MHSTNLLPTLGFVSNDEKVGTKLTFVTSNKVPSAARQGVEYAAEKPTVVTCYDMQKRYLQRVGFYKLDCPSVLGSGTQLS